GGGSRLGDLLEHRAFVRRVALHRLDEIRDQIMPSLQFDVDLAPGLRDQIALRDEPVVADHGADEHDEQRDHDDQNDRDGVHVTPLSDGFATGRPYRSASLAARRSSGVASGSGVAAGVAVGPAASSSRSRSRRSARAIANGAASARIAKMYHCTM